MYLVYNIPRPQQSETNDYSPLEKWRKCLKFIWIVSKKLRIYTTWLLPSVAGTESLCLFLQGLLGNRVCLECTSKSHLPASPVLKCVDKFPKWWRNNHFLKVLIMYAFKSGDLFHEEEGFKTNFVKFLEDLGFVNGVTPSDGLVPRYNIQYIDTWSLVEAATKEERNNIWRGEEPLSYVLFLVFLIFTLHIHWFLCLANNIGVLDDMILMRNVLNKALLFLHLIPQKYSGNGRIFPEETEKKGYQQVLDLPKDKSKRAMSKDNRSEFPFLLYPEQ